MLKKTKIEVITKENKISATIWWTSNGIDFDFFDSYELGTDEDKIVAELLDGKRQVVEMYKPKAEGEIE